MTFSKILAFVFCLYNGCASMVLLISGEADVMTNFKIAVWAVASLIFLGAMIGSIDSHCSTTKAGVDKPK